MTASLAFKGGVSVHDFECMLLETIMFYQFLTHVLWWLGVSFEIGSYTLLLYKYRFILNILIFVLLYAFACMSSILYVLYYTTVFILS